MRFCLRLVLLLSAAPAVLFGPATHAASPANDPFDQTWSPDGEFIAWSAGHGADFDLYLDDIFIIGTNGGDPLMLTEGMRGTRGPVWSPRQ